MVNLKYQKIKKQLTFKDSDHKLNKQLQIQIILFIALTDRDRSPK